MKILYCVIAIFMASMCGAYIAEEEWLRAIIYFICAFLNATWYVRECNRDWMDD